MMNFEVFDYAIYDRAASCFTNLGYIYAVSIVGETFLIR